MSKKKNNTEKTEEVKVETKKDKTKVQQTKKENVKTKPKKEKVEVDTPKDKVESETKKETIEVQEQKEKNEEVTTSEEKKNSNKLPIIIGIAVLVVIAAFVGISIFSDDDSNRRDRDDEDDIVDKREEEKEDDNEEANEVKEEVKEEVKYVGNPYIFSEDLAWFEDVNSITYLLNKKGQIIAKFDGKNYEYYHYDSGNFKGGYALLARTIVDKKGNIIELPFEYEDIQYADNGLLMVTIKESDYKGTTTKKGIYDIANKKYIYNPTEGIYMMNYIGESMFTIDFNNGNEDIVFNGKTGKSIPIGDRTDILKSTYNEGYIMYQETNAEEVYAMDSAGNKKLIATDSRHAQIGQFSDGLVFIKDAFYDINGNKVIDLKDEGIRNKPQFINGYALVTFNTGYFTILSKETKKYMFEPRPYTSMNNTYNAAFELGLYEDQTTISESGHLLVRLYDTETKEKRWAFMDYTGNIKTTLPPTVSLRTIISSNGLVGVNDSSTNESYYITVKGERIKISE